MKMKEIMIEAWGLKEALEVYGKPAVNVTTAHNDMDAEAFAEYVLKHKAHAVIIETVKGKKNTRLRPYSVESVPTDGSRKYKTVYQLIDSETGRIIPNATFDSKTEALAGSKDLISEKTHEMGSGKYECRIIKVPVEGTSVAFTMDYTPSEGTQLGTYMIIEK